MDEIEINLRLQALTPVAAARPCINRGFLLEKNMNIFKRFANRFANYKTFSEWKNHAAISSIGSLILDEMDCHEAPNCIEMSFCDGQGDVVATVTAVRSGGLSPMRQLENLRQQRDELLEALKDAERMLDTVQDCATNECVDCKEHASLHAAQARVAIAKAEGGTA